MSVAVAVRLFLCQAWNPATEEQCIDRCHRLGQKRKVVVTKVRHVSLNMDLCIIHICYER